MTEVKEFSGDPPEENAFEATPVGDDPWADLPRKLEFLGVKESILNSKMVWSPELIRDMHGPTLPEEPRARIHAFAEAIGYRWVEPTAEDEEE